MWERERVEISDLVLFFFNLIFFLFFSFLMRLNFNIVFYFIYLGDVATH
jgi:hypothetical protein